MSCNPPSPLRLFFLFFSFSFFFFFLTRTVAFAVDASGDESGQGNIPGMADGTSQEAGMRDHCNGFFLAVVEVTQTCLPAGHDGRARKGVGAPWSFVWVVGVYA